MNAVSRTDHSYPAANVPKKGMQGGFPRCSASLYSPKFFVLDINFLICSKTVIVRALTCAQVRVRRPIGAVLSAEMIDVRVEKLFIARHFYMR